MKKVLSLLLAFVFLDVQTWALSGGPVYTSGNLGAAVTGTYAGTMVPKLVNRIFQNPAFVVGLNADRNTLGLFILGVPASGEAAGNFLFFQDGEAYFGAITGFVDPANGKLTALTTGASATNNAANGVEFLSPISTVGNIKAVIVPGTKGSGLRIKGTAFFQLQGYAPDSSPNGVGLTTLREDTFVIDGWKQSGGVSNATITPPNTTTIPAPVPAP